MTGPASFYRSRADARSRLISAVLAVAVAAGILALLILAGIMPRVFVPLGTRSLSTFDVLAGQEAPTATAAERTPRPAARKARAAADPARTPPPPRAPTPPTPVAEAPAPPAMIVLSAADYAASDIGRIRGTAPAREDGAGSGTASRQVAGPGAGPGGKTLYAADWYREPSRAEIGPFLPEGVSEGWGMIACRTVARYRVEDCQVLGETPGSRIGQGLRRAAWQFLVIPPRENGRPMIGAWVRIRFDLIKGVEP